MANTKEFVIKNGVITPLIDLVPSSGIVTTQIGRLWYNTEDDTLNIGHENGVVQQIGQEFFLPPCKATENIPNGSFVMAVGAQDDKITIAKAVTNGTIDPTYMIGVAAHDIAQGEEFAKIIINGIVRDINTNAWSPGTILYPNPTFAGGWTNTKPVTPAIKTAIAIVLRQNATTGRIYVRMLDGTIEPSTHINATDDVTSTTLYPVMVSSAGSDQTEAKISTTNFEIDASTGTVTVSGSINAGNSLNVTNDVVGALPVGGVLSSAIDNFVIDGGTF